MEYIPIEFTLLLEHNRKEWIVSRISPCMLVLGKAQGHTGQLELDLSQSLLFF